MLDEWKKQDSDFFNSVDAMNYYNQLQLEDFVHAIETDIKPLVDVIAGRRTVELFTAIYRSNRDKEPVSLPLKPEDGDGAY